jgi:hypothetical protein
MMYPPEILPKSYEKADDWDYSVDDGTMRENVQELAEKVVGHRIVSAHEGHAKVANGWRDETGLILTLDNGQQVLLADTSDCCAFTYLEAFLLHPEKVDHIITGVGTTEQFTRWHIYADMGDVLELTVGWSPGNPYYYGYGFDIYVLPAE